MEYEIDLISTLKKTKPDYLLICTYTLSLNYLEKKFLNSFSRELDTKIQIITSNTGYSESMNELYSLNGIGTDYILTRINDYPYAFHPKVFLAINKTNMSLFVGGTNFSYPGLCLNWDTIEKIDDTNINIVTKNNLSLFLKHLSEMILNSKGIEHLSLLNKEFSRFQTNNSKITFIHNFEDSIGDQLLKMISSKIKKIDIISPYLDNDIKALKKLLKNTDVTNCSLLINNDDHSINLEEIPDIVKIFVPKSQIKSKNNSNKTVNRFIHSKLYILYTEDKVYSLIGSANCTNAGFWSKAGIGNFETGIIREHSDSEYIADLFNSFQLKEVKKYWNFIPPEKDKNKENLNKLLLFEAELQFDSIYIKPLSTFPIKINGSFFLVTNDGEIYNSKFSDISINDDKAFNIDLKEANRIAGTSCKIILEINSDITLKGEAWLIQNHIISRNKTIRNIMNSIRKFQNNDIEGWNELSKILNFISDNMHTISIRNKTSTQFKNHKTNKNKKNNIPIITEIYSKSEYFSQTNDYSTYLSNCIDIGRTLEVLIEKGLDLEPDTDLDEDMESHNIISKEKRTNDYKELIQEQESIERIKREKEKIISELPDLQEVYQHSIIKSANKFLTNKKLMNEHFYMFYTSFVNMLYLGLILSRFIIVEVPISNDSKKNKKAVYPTIHENKDVLLLFEKLTKIALSNDFLEKSKIVEILNNSEVISEIVIFLIELWATNTEQKIEHLHFFGIFNLLLKLFSKKEIINLVESAISKKTRYDEKRNNLFIKHKYIKKCLENIYNYQINKNKYEKFFHEYLKYTYWNDAINAEKAAYTTMLNNKSNNLKLIEEHKLKEKVATFKMRQLENKEKEFSGDTFNFKLRNLNNCIGIDEILVQEGNVICPSCNNPQPLKILFKIKEFVFVECTSCKKLFIPIPKTFKKYDVCKNTPSEWILSEEEKKVFYGQ